MGMKFNNNATSALAAGITNVATSLTVASGQGALFPSLGGSDYFYCTLANIAGAVEIVKVTARSGDTFTIVRGQDGTNALAWNTGDKVEQRVVAAELNDFAKLDEINTFTQTINEPAFVTIASAATVNIGAATSNNINISGTTTITAFDTITAGAIRRLVFGGVLTLTYNTTSLILPGSANITTAAGDTAEFVSLGSGNWKCFNYTKANGQPVVSSGGFDVGTAMLFQQTAAPTGWTKQTTHDNKALRVVSGTAGSGGSVAFTTAFASGLSAAATTLSSGQMPSHSHSVNTADAVGLNSSWVMASGGPAAYYGSTGTSGAGGGGSHAHSLPSFAVQYVDLIIASKN